MLIDLSRLSRRLDYEFNNPALLKQALSHCSVGAVNNERLEFLGDSILSYVIANALYERFPGESEGQLSRLRSFLVKGEMLAEIAMELELGDFLYLGQGELKSGGFRRASILADALEAIMAAVCLDGGLVASQKFILGLYETRLSNKNLPDTLKDAKTSLQEYVQAKKLPLPNYKLLKVTGEEHDQIFFISCSVKGVSEVTHGSGISRRKAEQEAATLLLQEIRKEED